MAPRIVDSEDELDGGDSVSTPTTQSFVNSPSTAPTSRMGQSKAASLGDANESRVMILDTDTDDEVVRPG